MFKLCVAFHIPPPFQVNATGVMPLIFASSLLALPAAVARYTDLAVLDDFAKTIGPGGLLYLPTNIALIIFFNYYYTFLQVRYSGREGVWCVGAKVAPCSMRRGVQLMSLAAKTGWWMWRI